MIIEIVNSLWIIGVECRTMPSSPIEQSVIDVIRFKKSYSHRDSMRLDTPDRHRLTALP